jgi:hypothetical protein
LRDCGRRGEDPDADEADAPNLIPTIPVANSVLRINCNKKNSVMQQYLCDLYQQPVPPAPDKQTHATYVHGIAKHM